MKYLLLFIALTSLLVGTTHSQCPDYSCRTCLPTDQSKCTECFATHYLNNDQCLPCPDKCFHCTAADNCKLCMHGHSFINGKCEPVANNVKGGVLVQSDEYTLCSGACNQCSDQVTCTHCQYFHFLESNSCTVCHQTCKKCDGSSSTDCTSCNFGYRLGTDNSCEQCPANCKICKDQKSQCTQCRLGYFLSSNSCEKCLDYCLECDDSNTCSTCQPGYTFISSAGCVECLQGCKTCLSNDISNCQECFDDHYNSSETGLCQPCPNQCSSCSQNGECLQCWPGYYVGTDKKCYETCQYPCKTCNKGQKEECLSCFQGYSLNGNQCDPVSCTSNCEVCPQGKVLKAQQCVSCTSDANCLTCSTNDQTVCTSCKTGWYLNGAASCVQCSKQGCLDCFNNEYCIKCDVGYYLEKFHNQITGSCLACSPKHHCKTCQQSPTWCTSCKTGFWRFGRRCLNNNYIDFEFTYPVNINKVGQTMNFTKNALATAIGISRVNINFHTMKYNQTSELSSLALYIDENDQKSVLEIITKLLEVANSRFITGLSFKYVHVYDQQNCGISNCKKCRYFETSVVCDTCLDSYVINDDATFCIKEECSNNQNSLCLCSWHQVLENGFCKSCLLDNCRLCSVQDSSKCDFCEAGYIINSQTSQCQSECTSELISACQCQYTQIYDSQNKKCIPCSIENCLLCSPDITKNSCDFCRVGYIYKQSTNKCVECEVPFCKKCSQNSEFQCQICLDGYSKDLTTKLCSVSVVCPLDQYFNGTQCTCAKRHFYSTLTKSCEACSQNCLNCKTLECIQCLPGYFVDKKSKLCSLCISNCIECTTESNCQRCEKGFSVIDNKCEAIPTNSPGLIEYTNPSDGKKVVGFCPGSCERCETPSVCETCPIGYYNSRGQCKTCNPNCKTCLDQNKNYCVTCYDEEILENGQCYSCPSNCLKCSNKDFCGECRSSYFINDQGKCEACPEGCSQCNNGIKGCRSCKSGYTLIGKQCVQCLVGCSLCDSSSIEICKQCDDHFYFVNTQKTQCAQCPKGCENCELNPISGKAECSVCMNGYSMYDDKLCYKSCKFPCRECNKGSPTSCISCFASYDLNGNSCQQNLDCNNEDNQNCVICPRGYVLVGNLCKQCSAKNNCDSCLSEDQNVCASCLIGFYLKDNSCLSCPDQCQTCLSEKYCTTCKDGYYSQEVEQVQTGKCKQCSGIYNCQTCIESPNKCTSCPTGYYLDGQKCLNKNHVLMEGQVVGSSISEITPKLHSFEAQLANQIGFAAADISIRKLQVGSVIITSEFSATDTVSTNDIKKTITNLFQAGKKIGLMEVDKTAKIQLVIGECQTANCAACQNDEAICESCESGFQLNNENKCESQPCAVQNCNACENNKNLECAECKPGYQLTSDFKCEAGSNLALILGLSIPLGIIAILILILVLMRSKKDREKDYESSSENDQKSDAVIL